MPRLTPRRVRLLILATVVGLVALYDRTTAILGVGSATVGVTLASAVPIRDAGVHVCRSREQAEGLARALHPEGPLRPVLPEGLTGRRFEVDVRTGSNHSGLGCERSFVQQSYLAVVADLADGRRVAKVVELPDVRTVREVTVALD